MSIRDMNGKIWNGTIININFYRPDDMQYAVDLDEYKEDYIFVGEKDLER